MQWIHNYPWDKNMNFIIRTPGSTSRFWKWPFLSCLQHIIQKRGIFASTFIKVFKRFSTGVSTNLLKHGKHLLCVKTYMYKGYEFVTMYSEICVQSNQNKWYYFSYFRTCLRIWLVQLMSLERIKFCFCIVLFLY